jgi:hypothetical protein
MYLRTEDFDKHIFCIISPTFGDNFVLVSPIPWVDLMAQALIHHWQLMLLPRTGSQGNCTFREKKIDCKFGQQKINYIPQKL